MLRNFYAPGRLGATGKKIKKNFFPIFFVNLFSWKTVIFSKEIFFKKFFLFQIPVTVFYKKKNSFFIFKSVLFFK